MMFDAARGRIDWTPTTTGTYSFALRAHNDWGIDEQSWTVEVGAAPTSDGGVPPTGRDGGSTDEPVAPAGCGCTTSAHSGTASLAPIATCLLVLGLLRRRPRRRRSRRRE
jgi:hypothetical protein